SGSWLPVFGIAIAFDVIVALLALLVLKPMRRGYTAAGSPALVGAPAE
ncbi:MAG: oxalate/formate MFS antiporter, partial [Hyphomicrobiales bacterium]|nr:oxalate/formate MFS antiporter [Hyphomicrobiales bacterium]